MKVLPSVCGYAHSLQMEGSPVFALVLEDIQIHPFIYVRIVRSMVADYDVQSFRTLQAAIRAWGSVVVKALRY